jgi:hypothetical protein
LQAAHGWAVTSGKASGWEKLVAGFTQPVANSEIKPDQKAVKVYHELLKKYAACELATLKKLA